MASRATRGGRTTPRKAAAVEDVPVFEAPRLLRSWAADIAQKRSARPTVMVELREGEYFTFANHMPPGLWPWFTEHLALEEVQPAEGIKFLTTLVVSADRDRLVASLSDVDDPIEIDDMWSLRRQLIEHYLARPTMPPPSSSPELSEDGAASAPSAPNTGSTPETSTRSASATSPTGG